LGHRSHFSNHAEAPNGAADKLQSGRQACLPSPLVSFIRWDGRRFEPVRQRMVIRSADGAARSIRAIYNYTAQ